MSPTADLITSPYLWGFFAMPRIALAPLMILWLGFGDRVKIWLVVLSAIIPIILSCKDGVQTTDESLIRAAHSFGADKLQLFAKVIAPNTLPFIASGDPQRHLPRLRRAARHRADRGHRRHRDRGHPVVPRDLDTARMFAFIATLIAGALLLVSLSRRLENYASRWREEVVL